jgi:phosphoribosylanthranilate isomerase
LPENATSLLEVADAVLLDARVAGRLGGTGVALPWRKLGDALRATRERTARPGRLVLAGGLTADNVGVAIESLTPDVVDTSSGIESSAGIKDPARMHAFIEAVNRADRALGPRPESSRSRR